MPPHAAIRVLRPGPVPVRVRGGPPVCNGLHGRRATQGGETPMMKAIGKKLALAAVAFVLSAFVGLLGAALSVQPVKADKAPPPSTLNVRELNVVDADGKAVITLTSVKGARGVWVNGFKKGTQAGIVACDGYDTPYLMVFDYRPDPAGKYPIGCQYAVSVNDGEPFVQLTGKADALAAFNPLRDAVPLVKKDDKPAAKVGPAKPILFDFPKRGRFAGD